MKISAATLLGLGNAVLVAAHGYVDNATIGGVYYQFYQPYTDPYTSPIVRNPLPLLPFPPVSMSFKLNTYFDEPLLRY